MTSLMASAGYAEIHDGGIAARRVVPLLARRKTHGACLMTVAAAPLRPYRIIGGRQERNVHDKGSHRGSLDVQYQAKTPSGAGDEAGPPPDAVGSWYRIPDSNR